MIVLLDNIRSLHNVGSIFRTADAVGVEKLYLCGITPSPLDRLGVVRGDVAKVSLGAENTVPWESVASTSRLITSLKKQGYTIVALEQDVRAVPYYEYAKTWIASSTRNDRGEGEFNKIALVLGAEVEGVSPAVLKKCDAIIDIPMSGKKESLNVSVAFGIAAYGLRYSRHDS
jgi:tRNA G18 (ribose-2'-O)-methylase SpoU